MALAVAIPPIVASSRKKLIDGFAITRLRAVIDKTGFTRSSRPGQSLDVVATNVQIVIYSCILQFSS